MVILHAGKLDVASLGESGMMLEAMSCLSHLVYIVREDDIVRISHRYEHAFYKVLIAQEL